MKVFRNAFAGAGYVPERDDVRLSGQMLRIWNVMKDGKWRTLAEIELETGDPQASISADLRTLRKKRWGSHIVKRHHIKNGLHVYKLIPNEETRMILEEED